jgi:hypothetical protein
MLRRKALILGSLPAAALAISSSSVYAKEQVMATPFSSPKSSETPDRKSLSEIETALQKIAEGFRKWERAPILHWPDEQGLA